MSILRFATFVSDIELPFYTSLASHKINHDKLDDSARRLLGFYELRPGDDPNTSCRMQIHGNALTSDELVYPKSAENLRSMSNSYWFRVPAGFYRGEGIIRNVNTIEDYRNLDKAAILNLAGRTVSNNAILNFAGNDN